MGSSSASTGPRLRQEISFPQTIGCPTSGRSFGTRSERSRSSRRRVINYGGFDEDDHEGRCRGAFGEWYRPGGCWARERGGPFRNRFARAGTLLCSAALLCSATLLRVWPVRLSTASLLWPPALQVLGGALAQVAPGTPLSPLVNEGTRARKAPAYSKMHVRRSSMGSQPFARRECSLWVKSAYSAQVGFMYA